MGIPICTKILSIDESSKKIELDKEPTQGTGSFVALQFTSANPGVYVERCEALKDIKSIIDERGDYVKITIRSEGDISRDSYKSIEKKERITEIFLKSYPIEIRPSEKQLEKAGIREKSDITIWTAMYDWMSYGIDFNDIEFANRSTVTWQNNIYDIKDKGLVSQVGD